MMVFGIWTRKEIFPLLNMETPGLDSDDPPPGEYFTQLRDIDKGTNGLSYEYVRNQLCKHRLPPVVQQLLAHIFVRPEARWEAKKLLDSEWMKTLRVHGKRANLGL